MVIVYIFFSCKLTKLFPFSAHNYSVDATIFYRIHVPTVFRLAPPKV